MRVEGIDRRPPGGPLWDEFPICLEELRAWYEAGESVAGLARELEVSEGTVTMRLAESGAVLRSRERGGRMELAVPSQVLRERYEAGETLSGLAASLGVAVLTVKVRLLEAGTVMRPVGAGAKRIELGISLAALRRRWEAGESAVGLAAELGVSEGTIRNRLKSAEAQTQTDQGRQDGQER
ncbi:helix-turn-helix domain-containing protein [Spirillospora sp. CA-108201]